MNRFGSGLVLRLRESVAAAVAVAAVLAGCGAGADAEQPASDTTTTTTTTTSSVETAANPVRALPEATGPPPRLRPGAYRCAGNPAVTFVVPDGWYGSGGSDGFGIGKGVDLAAQDFAKVGLFVHRTDLGFDAARSAFEALGDVEIRSEEESRLGGSTGRSYEVSVPGEHAILEPVGVFADIPNGDAEVMLLDVRGKTLLISLQRWQTSADRDEARRVLDSFRFSR